MMRSLTLLAALATPAGLAAEKNPPALSLGIWISETKEGIEIRNVRSGGVADQMELPKKARLTKINDVQIRTASDLSEALSRVGTTIRVEFQFEGKSDHKAGRIYWGAAKGENPAVQRQESRTKERMVPIFLPERKK